MKIHKGNFQSANFGQLFTHLKFVGLTQVISQIEAKTKKVIYKWGLVSKKICLPTTEKIVAGEAIGPPLVVRGLSQ